MVRRGLRVCGEATHASTPWCASYASSTLPSQSVDSLCAASIFWGKRSASPPLRRARCLCLMPRIDTVSADQRSEIMRAVRSRGNKATEIVFAALLRKHSITGWRRHANVPGKPDFVFRKERLAVFVDGCFWHGCASHCRMPSGNQGYWHVKIARNKARDKLVTVELRKRGWRVLRIWEHDLKNPDHCIRRTSAALSAPVKALAGKE